MRNAGIGQIIGVAVGVCGVCSIVVSTTAVLLKPQQELNKENDRKKYVLAAAGIIENAKKAPRDSAGLRELFGQIDTRLINVDTGEVVEEDGDAALSFDVAKAAKEGPTSRTLDPKIDKAKIRRMSTVQRVYLKKDAQENIERFILPIYGKGLWGPMYGFLALDADGETIEHLSYYDHIETPGLGGEVDSKDFKQAWPGLVAYNEAGQPQIDVTKGQIPKDNDHEVASLSGATITSNGVEAMVNFWLSDNGYGKFIKKHKKPAA